MPRTGLRVAAGALLLVAVGVVACFSYLNRAFELDDALIYQRYVRNALEGHGLVFNPGERFNALTSPLFSYLSLALSSIVGDVGTAGLWLAALSTAGAAVALGLLFAREGKTPVAATGALLLAVSPFVYSTFGMETPLYLLSIALCLHLFRRGRLFGLALAAALLVLVRTEGLFLLAVLAGERLVRRRPLPRARQLALPALLVAGVLLFNQLYYGRPLPETAAAKIEQGRSGLWGDWPLFADVGYHLEWFFGGRPWLAGGLLLLAGCGLFALRRSWLTRVWLLFLGITAAFYVVLNIPNYHWYYAPFYAALFGYAGAGIDWLVARAWAPRTAVRRVAAAALLVAPVLAWLGTTAVTTTQRLAATAVPPAYRQIGLWMRDHLPREASLAAAEVGTLGWYSRLTLVDILGLVTAGNAHFLGERRLAEWFDRTPADYALAHDPAWGVEAGIVEAVDRGALVRVPQFAFDGFKLYRRVGPMGPPLAARLDALRQGGGGEERERLTRAILDQGLFEPQPLVGGEILTVHLTADRWTRGTSPAGLVVTNRRPAPYLPELQLACPAPPESLPIRVWIDDGESRRALDFETPGFLDLELEPLAPGEDRLYLLWTDRSWTPGPHDPRSLGVKLFPPGSGP